MGRRMLAVIAAALVALLGVVFVLLYARGADERAVADESPRTVYVSAEKVPVSTSLREAMRLKLVIQTQTAAKAVPAGALTTVDEENAGLLALTDIPPGQYLLAKSFGETPTGQQAIQVPTGKLAVAVLLTDPARVGDFVKPGNYLTVFATYPTPLASSSKDSGAKDTRAGSSTQVLLDNVQVIGVGDTPLSGPAVAPSPDPGDTSAQADARMFLVTLAVTPEQATRLVHAINNFVLYAGLRGSDVEVDPGLHTDDLSIFGTS